MRGLLGVEERFAERDLEVVGIDDVEFGRDGHGRLFGLDVVALVLLFRRRIELSARDERALVLGVDVAREDAVRDVDRDLVERRGRQLLRAEIDRACSDFRVNERTNLAVELHDTISQNLTGVALELNIAGRKAPTNLPVALDHLGLAQRSLASCRQELRNCLWDLRNRALDEPDMNEAIRRTLRPQTGDAELSIRFCVPRKRISDDTAHAILRILRELASNAVRHGHAKRIKIAGADEEGAFKMSVQDDGCGFDPTGVAGVEQGHFGLQGIRERLKTMNGTMTLSSSPGHGTKVVMTICRITRE